MALEGSYTDNAGVVHPNAYAKVVLVNSSYISSQGVGTLSIYHDQAARDAGVAPLENVKYLMDNDTDPAEPQLFTDYLSVPVIDPDGKNPVTNMYEYAKTLSRWQGWIDV